MICTDFLLSHEADSRQRKGLHQNREVAELADFRTNTINASRFVTMTATTPKNSATNREVQIVGGFTAQKQSKLVPAMGPRISLRPVKPVELRTRYNWTNVMRAITAKTKLTSCITKEGAVSVQGHRNTKCATVPSLKIAAPLCFVY